MVQPASRGPAVARAAVQPDHFAGRVHVLIFPIMVLQKSDMSVNAMIQLVVDSDQPSDHEWF